MKDSGPLQRVLEKSIALKKNCRNLYSRNEMRRKHAEEKVIHVIDPQNRKCIPPYLV